MKRVRRLCWLCLVLLLPRLEAEPLFETVTIFPAAPRNRPSHRIPALIRAPSNDLLAFTEKRNDGIGDLGNHDLVLIRSSDRGRTRGAEELIYDDGDRTCTDSTICIDRERGRIFFSRPGKIRVFRLRRRRHGLARPGRLSCIGHAPRLGALRTRQQERIDRGSGERGEFRGEALGANCYQPSGRPRRDRSSRCRSPPLGVSI